MKPHIVEKNSDYVNTTPATSGFPADIWKLFWPIRFFFNSY